MGEHSGIYKSEEHDFTRRDTEDISTAQHEIGMSYPAAHLRQLRQGGRGSGETRTRHLLQLQRTYGNAASLRAVQRQGDEGV